MKTDHWQMAAALAAGAGLGLIFFGGLWLTVRRIPESRNPQLLLISSFFLRLAVTLVALYALLPWGWQAMAFAMAGLLVVRQLLVKTLGSPPPQDIDHAPP